MVVVYGATGKLGQHVISSMPLGSYIAYDRCNSDIADMFRLHRQLTTDSKQYGQIDCVINCAVYSNNSYIDDCYRANYTGAYSLATICRKLKLKLLHISCEEANPMETSVYGKSKYAGDVCVKLSGCDYRILYLPSEIFPRLPGDFFGESFIEVAHFIANQWMDLFKGPGRLFVCAGGGSLRVEPMMYQTKEGLCD